MSAVQEQVKLAYSLCQRHKFFSKQGFDEKPRLVHTRVIQTYFWLVFLTHILHAYVKLKDLFFFFKVGIDISKLDGIVDDLDFTEKLISEQSVFCLPGKVLSYCHIGVFPF